MSKPISNKSKGKNKQKPAQDPVLLGFPDGSIDAEQDSDAYATKIGGVPNWLQSDHAPPLKFLLCGVCKRPMYLIFQGYVPLAASIYHRVIYVWACNRRLCMRKEGSFSVVRSHLVDPEYLAANRRKEEEKRKKEQQKLEQQQRAAQPFGAFQLGDLWGSGTPSFSEAATKATDTTKTNAPATASVASDDLTTSLENLTVVDTPQEQLPIVNFPGEYLWITEENLDNYDAMGIDMERYREYLDLQNSLLEATEEATGEESWSGETYEKQQLPRGVDKQFKKFAERVQLQPSQCVRYQWGGTPLLYHQLQGQQQQQLGGRCSQCGNPRIFELQLMPNILSLLPTSEYASADLPDDAKKGVNSWDIGMEFGTILVFVCGKDCHPVDIEQPCYVKEHLLVQYESD
ncbi:programmed cell death protein 2 [Zychaea mexicana]|uniref:programmed cell death protein 2 n=1 Tax=Zychaea mexicana TaxID=64656 RepID=UPI0022FEBF4F|nr:programmed cell death protein 2 [Zychaea mexicana]KAI9493103.1 programmed cell death protein 2 [Zychaea mexicana]